MIHGCFHSPDRTSLLGLVCVIAIAAASCVPTRSPVNGSSGGAIGSGAASGTGGSAGGGGGTVGSSGGQDSPSGGSAGAVDAGAIGSGGSSGPPPANIPCTGDVDCTASGQFCEPATKLCVQCTKTKDCPPGGHCLGNRCVNFTPCSSKSDCSSDPICDSKRGVCVQCVADADCPTGKTCNANKCEAVSTCKLNSDCSTGLCDCGSGGWRWRGSVDWYR